MMRKLTISCSLVALAAAGTASAFEFEAGDTTVSLEGYAKLDMIYDVNDRLGPFATYSNIGTDTSEGHYRMHAKQSRFGLRTVTPTSQGDLTLFVNMDFLGGDDEGSRGDPRLREFYGEWNGWLAGRTWSNFNTFVGTPFTLDFTNAIGQPGQDLATQLRYTFDNGVAVALEAPDDVVSGWSSPRQQFDEDGDPLLEDRQKSRVPDLTVSYEGAQGVVNYAAGAMLRELRYDDSEGDDDTLGWGVFGAANTTFDTGTTIRGAFTYGDGIGNYNYFQPQGPAYIHDGDLETIEAYGLTLSASQPAGPGEFTLAWAMAKADVDDLVDDLDPEASPDETWQSVFFNYAFSPVDRVTVGGEIGWHKRELQDGSDDDAVRLQASFIYDF